MNDHYYLGLVPRYLFMKTLLLIFLALTSVGVFAQADQILARVPAKYITDLNVVEFKKGEQPKIEDSVKIGSIGEDFVILNGRRYGLALVQLLDDDDLDMIQIATKLDNEGGWAIVIAQVKKGRQTNWHILQIEFTSRDRSKPDGELSTYKIILGKHPSK